MHARKLIACTGGFTAIKGKQTILADKTGCGMCLGVCVHVGGCVPVNGCVHVGGCVPVNGCVHVGGCVPVNGCVHVGGCVPVNGCVHVGGCAIFLPSHN